MKLMRLIGPLAVALVTATPGPCRECADDAHDRRPNHRHHSRRPAPAGHDLRRLARDLGRSVARQLARLAAHVGARRCARRGDLSEGQAAQTRTHLAQRIQRRARPRRKHPKPRAVGFYRPLLHDGSAGHGRGPQAAPGVDVRSRHRERNPGGNRIRRALADSAELKDLGGRGSVRSDDARRPE